MRGINICTFGGNVAADPELRTVAGRNGDNIDLIEFTMYADENTRKGAKSFTVKVTVWQTAPCFTAAGYIRKGTELTVTGALSVSPYITKTDNLPRAGAQLNAVQIVLGRSPRDEDQPQGSNSYEEVPF